MKRSVGAALILLAVCAALALPAKAQQVFPPGPSINGAVVCAYNTSPPTVTTGQWVLLQCDSNGKLITSSSGSAGAIVSNATSGIATTSTNQAVVAYNYGFNGTTWDQLQVDTAKSLKVVLSGNSGAITQSSVSVTNASTALLTAAQFANFEKICVAFTAATGVWINWAGVAAVAAAPSEYMPPGQCDTWVKSTGFMPTAAAFAISNSASTIAVTVEGN